LHKSDAYLAIVPLPSALPLLYGALAGLVAVRRRRELARR
jgi:hypothetical protein